MSTVFRRSGSPYYYVGIPTRSGGWIKQSARTRDKSVAKAMARMVERLRDKHERVLLDAVCSGQLRLEDLFAADTANDLEGLKARLQDVDLAKYRDAWLADVESRLSPDTRYRYDLHVSGLVPEEKTFLRSELTVERIVAYLASWKGGRATKRRVHAALSSFCEFLAITARVIPRNPMRDVVAPAAPNPRDRYLETIDEVRALAKAQPEPYRTLCLLLHATGMELSVALGGTELPGGERSEPLKRREVDVERREIRARGTKTRARDRFAKVADWAWPDIKRFVSLLTPEAPLFPGINRYTASDKHREACKALGIEGYQLRDARHTYCVRAIRAGASFEVVARQLGHANTAMVVKVYGRYRPTAAESVAWERKAAAQDRRARAGAPRR